MKVRRQLGSFPFAPKDPPPYVKGRGLDIKTLISNSWALSPGELVLSMPLNQNFEMGAFVCYQTWLGVWGRRKMTI